MPIYEYVCRECGRRSSLLFRSFSSVEEAPHCPHCQSAKLSRVPSRLGAVRVSHRASSVGDLHAVDPRRAAESLSRQYDEVGIDPGRGFEDVAKRVAAGDSAETLHEAVKEARKNEQNAPSVSEGQGKTSQVDA